MKKKLKRVVSFTLIAVTLASTLSSTVAKASSAEELGQQMIDYYESKEYAEDDLENIKEGLTDPDALRLMGIMASNWLEPGTIVNIEDVDELAKTLAKPIKKNIVKNESVANAYASAIAANIVTGSKKVTIKRVTGTRIYNRGTKDTESDDIEVPCNRGFVNKDSTYQTTKDLISSTKAGGYIIKLETENVGGGKLKSYKFFEIKKVLTWKKFIYGYETKDGSTLYVYNMVASGKYNKTTYASLGANLNNKSNIENMLGEAVKNGTSVTIDDYSVAITPSDGGQVDFPSFGMEALYEKVLVGADYLPEMSKSSRVGTTGVSLNEILIGDKLKNYPEKEGEGDLLKSGKIITSGKTEALTTYIELKDGENLVWSSGNISCRSVGAIIRNKILTTTKDNAIKVLSGVVSEDVKEYNGTTGKYGNGVDIVVDCFGNLWATKGDKKGYLLVPGCMNPYTFSKDGSVTPLNNCHTLGYFYSNGYKSSSAFNQDNMFTNACIQRTGKGSYVMDYVVTNKKATSTTTAKYFTSSSTYVMGSSSKVQRDAEGKQTVADKFLLWDSKTDFTTYMRAIPKGVTAYMNSDGTTGIFGSSKGVKANNVSMVYHGNNYFSLDLLVYGGVWEEGGGWTSIIEDGTKEMSKSEAFCSEAEADIDSYGNVKLTEAKKSSFVYGLYIVYAYVLLGEDITINKDNYLGNETDNVYGTLKTADLQAAQGLPTVITDPSIYEDLLEKLQQSLADSELDEDKKNIIEALATILNPKSSYGYITSLLKQRSSELTLSWHYSLLGLSNNTDNSVLSGDIGYSSSNGYVTIPELENISWTSYILNNFDTVLIVSLIVISAIMLLYILLSMRSIQRAILNVFIFGLCLFLVPVLLSSTITVANAMSNKLVNNKFQYWVVAQQQAFIKELNKAEEEEDRAEYLSKTDVELAAFANGSSSVATVRWMSPKKDNYIAQILGVLEDNGDAESNKVIAHKAIFSTVKTIGTSMLSGQRYTDGNVGYLYRSYSDISTYAKMQNKAVNWKLKNDKDVSSLKYFDTDTYYNSASGTDKEQLQQRHSLNSGYPISERISAYGKDKPDDTQSRYKMLTTSETVNNAIRQSIKRVNIDSSNVEQYTTGDFAYGFSINYDDKDFQPQKLAKIYKNNDSEKYSLDKLGEYQFLLYTESPFYYLFNNFGDKGTLTDTEGAFKTYVLAEGNITSKETTNENGEPAVVDYVDFEGFFKYVLPYMRQTTDVVTDYDKLYGMNVYSTIVDAKADLSALKDNKNYQDSLQKIWHNEMVSRLWNMYSPWVDLMEECEYSESETFTTMVSGVQIKATVTDPLNPASYKKMKLVDGKWYGREMVFGEEQMLKAGLRYDQLSSVEKKIYDVLRNSTTDIYNLLNYYTYDNQVLTTSAAMSVLFNFNKEFSQNKVLGDSKTLYPQGYALDNFSYDSYLRMTLINSTGMNLTGGSLEDQGVYATVIDKTNGFVGLIMCLNDILAIFILTNLKIFFVVAILILGILSILCCITVDEYKIIKTFKDSVIIPCAKFLLMSLAHSFIAGLLMGNSKTNIITNTSSSSNITDPVGILLVLLVVHIVFVVLYFKLGLKMVSDIVSMTMNVVGNVGGAIAQLGSNLVSASGVRPATAQAGESNSNFSGGNKNTRGSVINRDRMYNRRLNRRFGIRSGFEGIKNNSKRVANGVNNTLRRGAKVAGVGFGLTKLVAKPVGRFLGKKAYGLTPEQRYLKVKQKAKDGKISAKEAKAYYLKHKKSIKAQKSVEKFGSNAVSGAKNFADKTMRVVGAPVRGTRYIQNSLKQERIRKDIVRASRRAKRAEYFRPSNANVGRTATSHANNRTAFMCFEHKTNDGIPVVEVPKAEYMEYAEYIKALSQSGSVTNDEFNRIKSEQEELWIRKYGVIRHHKE